MSDTQYINVSGVNLEYEWFGPSSGDAVTLVMLHEGLGCVAMWRAFGEKLSQLTGFGVLMYSRQGYGNSDACTLPRPLSYMHDEAEKVLPELVRVAGLKRYILLGHSDGGSIALIYAGKHSNDGLCGVICESPHVFCEQLSVDSIRAARQAYEETDLKNRLHKYHGENTHCAFWGWNDAWLHPEFMNWNIEGFLSDISVPVLVVQGVDDQYGTVDQIHAIEAQSGGEVTVALLDRCGHSPHREQEEQTLAVMQDFLICITR